MPALRIENRFRALTEIHSCLRLTVKYEGGTAHRFKNNRQKASEIPRKFTLQQIQSRGDAGCRARESSLRMMNRALVD
jgi:hypothetical protein